MNRTKAAIMDAFWQLLEERPYNKITVKDIVNICQINRNTFYYHFHDIPDLLESTLKQDADYIIRTYCSFGAPIECLTPFVRRTLERKKALLHLYRSVQREFFLEYLERISLYIVTQYVNTVTSGQQLPPKDKKLLIRFCKCAMVGVLLDWMDADMGYDLLEQLMRITDLFGGAGSTPPK